MRAALILLACLALAGCGGAPRIQTIRVPVPVPCDEPIPPRPAMPTEALQPAASVHTYVLASQAEIERREGYEGQLRAALVACTQPLQEQHP